MGDGMSVVGLCKWFCDALQTIMVYSELKGEKVIAWTPERKRYQANLDGCIPVLQKNDQ